MKKLIIAVLIAVGTLLIFNIVNANEFPNVNAKYDYENIDYSNYTNSDSFDYENNIFDLSDYKQKLWNKNVKYTYDTMTNTDKLIVSGDDPIVNVIPRDFFIYRGEYFHIGNEYAFYITNRKLNDFNNFIEVLIIDINSSYDVVSTISHKVTPIFQGNFLYLTEQGGFNFSTAEENNRGIIRQTTISGINISKEKTLIVPFFSISKLYDSDDLLIYAGTNFKEANRYLLKNISIGVAIHNEQQLNIGDENYVGIKDNRIVDKGTFITRTDLMYKGTRMDNGEGGWDKEICSFILSTAIGFIPVVGTIASIVLSGIETGLAIADNYKEIVTEVEQGSTGIDIKYGSAEEQITKAGTLNKFGFVTTRDNKNDIRKKSMVIGHGGYFEASFSLGQTQDLWATRVSTVLEMEIMDSYNKNVGMKKHILLEKTIRNYETKQLKLNQNTDGYSLFNGKDIFEFKPNYSSSYMLRKIDFSNSIVKVYDENDKQINQSKSTNTEIEYFFEEGKTYRIEIISNLKDIYTLSIGTKMLSLGANEKVGKGLYGFKSAETDVLRMIHNNEGALLTLLNIDATDILRAKISGTMINYYIKNQIYCVFVENVQNIETLSITEIESYELDQIIHNLSSAGGDIMYKFNIKKTGNYAIPTQNFANNSQGVVMFKKYGEKINYTQKVTEITRVFEFSVDEGDIIYFGAYNTEKNQSYVLSLTQTNNEFVWIVNGKKLEKNLIEAMQGEKINFELKWFNQPFSGQFETSHSSQIEILEKGIILIRNNAMIDATDYAVVFATGLRNTTNLTIVVKSALEFKLEKIHEGTADTGVEVSATFINNSSAVIKGYFNDGFYYNHYVEFTLKGNRDGKHSITSIVRLGKEAEKQLQNLWSFKIYEVNMTQTFENGISTTKHETSQKYNTEIRDISHLFKSGNGSSTRPYEISTAYHVENMKNNHEPYWDDDNYYYDEISGFYKLVNDINLGSWNNIKAEFVGVFYANYQLKITFKTYGDGFFSRLNNATIRNIIFDVEVNGVNSDFVGGVAGTAHGSTISNCEVKGTVIDANDTQFVGGVIGLAGSRTIIENVISRVTITGKYYLGGIVSYGNGVTIRNSKFYGKINLKERKISKDEDNSITGGIIGIALYSTNISNCTSTCSIAYDGKANKNKLLKPRIGGMIGEWDGKGNHNNNASGGVIIDYGTLNVSWKVFLGGTYSQTTYINIDIGKMR